MWLQDALPDTQPPRCQSHRSSSNQQRDRMRKQIHLDVAHTSTAHAADHPEARPDAGHPRPNTSARYRESLPCSPQHRSGEAHPPTASPAEYALQHYGCARESTRRLRTLPRQTGVPAARAAQSISTASLPSRNPLAERTRTTLQWGVGSGYSCAPQCIEFPVGHWRGNRGQDMLIILFDRTQTLTGQTLLSEQPAQPRQRMLNNFLPVRLQGVITFKQPQAPRRSQHRSRTTQHATQL